MRVGKSGEVIVSFAAIKFYVTYDNFKDIDVLDRYNFEVVNITTKHSEVDRVLANFISEHYAEICKLAFQLVVGTVPDEVLVDMLHQNCKLYCRYRKCPYHEFYNQTSCLFVEGVEFMTKEQLYNAIKLEWRKVQDEPNKLS